MNEVLMELFKKRKMVTSNTSLPKYDTDEYGEVMAFEDVTRYEKMFNRTITELKNIVKSNLPGCKIDDSDVIKKVLDYDGVKVYSFRKTVVSIKDNFNTINAKFDISGDKDSVFEDVDGSDLYEFLESKIFNKIRNFNELEGTYGIFEHKDHEWFVISSPEDLETIGVSLHIAVATDTIVEEGLFKNITSKSFANRKKDKEKSYAPLPKKIEKREYDVEDVKKELKEVIKFVTNDIKTNYKDFNKKGLEPLSFFKSFYYFDEEMDIEGDTFSSGEEFPIVDMDLWDYPGGNPRLMLQDTGEHPVYDVQSSIESTLKDWLIQRKSMFKIADYGGDWDTGSICVELI